MIKNDFKITVSCVDGDFNISATGDVSNIVQGAILTIASFLEAEKKDGTSDSELEDYIIGVFRMALERVREIQVNCEKDVK